MTRGSVYERYAIYCSLFNALWRAREEQAALSDIDVARLEEWYWQRKLAERARLVQAYLKRDAIIQERPAPSHVD